LRRRTSVTDKWKAVTLVYPLDARLDPELRLRLVGRKAAGLHEMIGLGIPVPPGFTITTEVGDELRESGSWPEGVEAAVEDALARLEEATGRRFGDPDRPLLLSVRSGAPVSMPGMMDTILDVGLNRQTLEGLATSHQDERFALDSYRRLLRVYGNVVRRISSDRFRFRAQELKETLGRPRALDSELDAPELRSLVHEYEDLIAESSGDPFPQDVHTQLWDAARAIFVSWTNPRAVSYRRMQGIDGSVGTACTIQAMVFGNAGPASGSGVAFSRNPSTGLNRLYGEYIAGAQGEDLVAGTRTPVPLASDDAVPGREAATLERSLPDAFAAVSSYCKTLERHFADMQDVEFTIENGETYILQTRSANRTARAAVRIAVDMVHEGILSKNDAVMSVDARSLEQLLQSRLPSATTLSKRGFEPAAVGLPASPGAASGRIVFDPTDAVRWVSQGEEVILVRQETSAEDVHGVRAAEGVVTAAGGMTSHAAVVARGLGKCCVVGCDSLRIDFRNRTLQLRDAPADAPALREGDLLTLDGSTGRVYTGALDLEASSTVPELDQLMEWVEQARRLRILGEACTPQQIRTALSYGAEGIGLCRTERMFSGADRLFTLQCALLAIDDDVRADRLEELESAQRADFVEIFRAAEDRPVTVLLFDRALEEVMPKDEATIRALAVAVDLDATSVSASVGRHLETNPMFGHRGIRAGLTFRGLYEMQLRAMIGAARDCVDRGLSVELDVLVPMVTYQEEVAAIAGMLDRVRSDAFDEPSAAFTCRLGAMIELPRACLVAHELAAHVDFFSFDGSKLTQSVLGVTSENASRFLPAYRNELALVTHDPFAALDPRVFEMMHIALERGRKTNATLIAGLCGDLGGSPEAIDACEALGLDFVSAPLAMLPGARLAAAQATMC
jgi:pyruvate,orthophosphate dikinase